MRQVDKEKRVVLTTPAGPIQVPRYITSWIVGGSGGSCYGRKLREQNLEYPSICPDWQHHVAQGEWVPLEEGITNMFGMLDNVANGGLQNTMFANGTQTDNK